MKNKNTKANLFYQTFLFLPSNLWSKKKKILEIVCFGDQYPCASWKGTAEMQKNKSSTCFPVTVRQANDDKAGKAFETQIKYKANSYFNNSLS